MLVILFVAILALIILVILSSIRITATTVLEKGKKIQKIDLSHMEELRKERIVVYSYLEHGNLAKEVAEALAQGWQIAQRRLGLDLGRLRVALVVPQDKEVGGVTIEGKLLRLLSPIIPILTPPQLQSLQEAKGETLALIYWAVPHEAMELALLRKLYHDRSTRWVGDGLAEYMGYIITRELAPEAQQWMLERRRKHIQALLDQGHSQYNLTKEFLVRIKGLGKDMEVSAEKPTEETAGYSVALAFWLQIVHKHGEGVIKEFWQRLSQRRFPNAKEAARILSELTGEDIWTKLQNIDLHEVLQTLERAAGAP